MLEAIQKTLLDDVHNGTRKLGAYLDKSITNIEERIDIFYGNRLHGTLDYLKTLYPVVLQLLGEEFFEKIARQFINSHKLESGNRHDYGGWFATFLRSHQDLAKFLYVADVAAIEWAHFRAFLAEDRSVISFEKLGELMAAGTVFGIEYAPGACTIAAEYNSFEIWQAHQNGDFEQIILRREKSNIVCWRDANDEILFLEISNSTLVFITNPLMGINFAAALERALSRLSDEDQIQIMQNQFAQLVQNGAFVLSDTQ